MARRDDREYREYLREKQRRQPGCLARKVLPIQLIRATTSKGEGCARAALEPEITAMLSSVGFAPPCNTEHLSGGTSQRKDLNEHNRDRGVPASVRTEFKDSRRRARLLLPDAEE